MLLYDICDMTPSHVWHDSFTCMTWLLHLYGMTPRHIWHDSITHMTWLLHLYDTTPSHIWHDPITYMTWPHHMYDTTQSTGLDCLDWQYFLAEIQRLSTQIQNARNLLMRDRSFGKRGDGQMRMQLLSELEVVCVCHDSSVCVPWPCAPWLRSEGQMRMQLSSSMCVLCLIYVCAMTMCAMTTWRRAHADAAFVWSWGSMCVPWLIYVCAMTHPCVCHDGCMKLLSELEVVCLCHDSFICVPWRIHVCAMKSCMYGASRVNICLYNSCRSSRQCHDSFLRVPWLIHVCAITLSYVCHNSFTCVPWLVRMWTCSSYRSSR